MEVKANRKFMIGGIAAGVVAVILVAAVVVLMVFNVRMYNINTKLSKYVDDELARQAAELVSDDYIEDGYLVGGVYEIKSTTEISDAYKNGDTSALSEDDKKTYDLAVAVLDEVIKDGMSNYEKEVAVYDWIVNEVSSGNDSTTVTRPGSGSAEALATPYGVLSNHTAVCVGYATTFRLLMNMLGMDCHIVHNDYHSWDLVQLDDGEWYHVDLYSDSETHSYQNFNMTDSMARSGHDWNANGALPEADGYQYTYAYQNVQTVTGFSDIPQLIYDRAVGNGDSFGLYLKTDAGFTAEDFDAADILVDEVNTAFMSGQMPVEFYNKSISGIWADGENGSYILCLYISDASTNYGDDTTSDTNSQETAEEIIGYINDAFGISLSYGDSYNYYDIIEEYADSYNGHL